jgi:glutamine synthetase
MFVDSELGTSLNHAFVSVLFDLLERFNVQIEGAHTETGPGVFEATILFDEMLAAADKAVLFKNGVKEIGYRHGFVSSFMAKWNSKLPGCGGHLHQSLWDKTGTNNLFSGSGNPNKLVSQYIAGMLTCLPEVLPMYAPNVNSYKRIGHGDWAPANITWGTDNRTAAVRFIPGNTKTTRLELRVPGADTNPYLAMAASLASGLYGIKNQLELTFPETKGNSYNDPSCKKLPANLADATQKKWPVQKLPGSFSATSLSITSPKHANGNGNGLTTM